MIFYPAGITGLCLTADYIGKLFLAESSANDAAKTDDSEKKMAWYLKIKEGKARYAKRKSTVEPVFGIIKQVKGVRQFSLRGLVLLSVDKLKQPGEFSRGFMAEIG